MARFGDYETERQLATRGLTSVFVARRVGGSGPATAVVKVLGLPEGLAEVDPAEAAPGGAQTPASAASAATTAPVFVSHSTTDKAKADAVCAALERAGVRCWIAPRDILPGANWASSILRAIGESRLVMLLLSEQANTSQHIRREVERAVSRNVPIAPMRIENVMPRDDLEYFLSASHWFDAIAEPFEQHLPRLVEDVRALLGAQAAPNCEIPGAGAATGSPTTAGVAERPAVKKAASPREAVARAAQEQFIEAARVQQSVAEKSPHWACVHDLGEFPGGAFTITDYCRHSVQRCIEGGVRLDEAGLYAIALGMVNGLADFHAMAGRAHGDVEPSNVLLRADPRERIDAGVNAVAMIDPLSTPQLTPRHTVAADLQDAGRLIYQLIEGERTSSEIPAVVEPSPAWKALGSNWREWIELCNVMLGAGPGSTLTAALVRDRLAGIKPRAKRPSRAVAGMAAAVVALAVAAPVVWFVVKNSASGDADKAGAAKGLVSTASPAGSLAPADPSPSAPGPVDAKASGNLFDRLMEAKNPASPFPLTLSARQEPLLADPDQDGVTFTISSSRPGYLILLTRDTAGEVSLLVPNPRQSHIEQVIVGETQLPIADCGYDFPVGPPYGKTWMKAIVTSRPLELVDVETIRDAEGKPVAIKSARALRLANGPESLDPGALLRSDEWTTAECVIETHER